WLAVVHGAGAVGRAVAIDGAVAGASGLDSCFERVGEQLVDVGAHGCGSASDRDVLEERRLRAGHQLLLGYADATDCAAGPRDLDCRLHRLVEANALEHRVDAVAVGQALHALDRLAPSVADDVGRAERARERSSL